MQNEKDYLYYYNGLEPNHDFEIVAKSGDTLLVFEVLDKNLYLYIVDVNDFFLFFFHLIVDNTILSSNFQFSSELVLITVSLLSIFVKLLSHTHICSNV